MKYNSWWIVGIGAIVAVPTILWLHKKKHAFAAAEPGPMHHPGRILAHRPSMPSPHMVGGQYGPFGMVGTNAPEAPAVHVPINHNQRMIYEGHGVANQKLKDANDPYDIGFRTPLPPPHIDVGPWTGGNTRIGKQVISKQMQYAGPCYR
jgi:hypothetical protein